MTFTGVVVDTSVAIKWFLREPDSDRADAVLSWGGDLLAPCMLLAEVANGLRRQQRAGIMPADAVSQAVAGLAAMFVELLPTPSVIVRALQNSQSLDHSIYDCLFLAASQIRRVPLVTADVSFATKLAKTPEAGNVILLADWKT